MNLLISSHSFVDLITNSSSELFICDTNKNVETIKQIIQKLAKLYNDKMDLKDNSYKMNLRSLWTTVFAEPEVSKYSFNLVNFPRVADYKNMFGQYSHDYNHTHPVKEKAQEKMRAWERQQSTPKWKENMTKKEKKEYDDLHAEYYKEKNKVAAIYFKEWSEMILDIYKSLYEWAAKENNINLSKLGNMTVEAGEYPSIRFSKIDYWKKKPSKEESFAKTIEDAIDWRYHFKKGDIFLRTASDNSVPYDFFSDIEAVFSVQRLHIG